MTNSELLKMLQRVNELPHHTSGSYLVERT